MSLQCLLCLHQLSYNAASNTYSITMGATTKPQRPDCFTPLLAEIRSGLGDCWSFYEECIDGVLDAAAKQQDMTAWFEQMQQLVEGVNEVQISHEGILFLLRDMGVRAPERRSRGEGEDTAHGMYHSPPLSLAKKPSELDFSSIDDSDHHNNDKMAHMPARPPSSMNPPLPLRALRPNMPAITAWPPPRVPTPRTHHTPRQQQEQQQQQQQEEQNHQPANSRQNVKPFDFSATVLPELTYPENIRDYFYPRDEITITENYEPPTPNPLRKASHNPVFFNSTTLRASIAELFGHPVRHHHHNRRHSHSVWQPPPALPYVPDEDDLAAWKKRTEGGADNGYEKNDYFDTVPPWNGRFDSELD
jgi:hypothetical protein